MNCSKNQTVVSQVFGIREKVMSSQEKWRKIDKTYRNSRRKLIS